VEAKAGTIPNAEAAIDQGGGKRARRMKNPAEVNPTLNRRGLLIQDNELVIWATLKRVHGLRNSSGSLAIFAAIRRAYARMFAGCGLISQRALLEVRFLRPAF
jgi:hypothetical protein